jgi:hypothetical protein
MPQEKDVLDENTRPAFLHRLRGGLEEMYQ